MEYVLQSERKFPAGKYDVIICGGGTSGVFAAIAAARKGVKQHLLKVKGMWVELQQREAADFIASIIYGRRFLN